MDLGIAVGSAVSIASDFRIDNRIMYSAGLVAIKTGLLPRSVKVAIGISNPIANNCNLAGV